MKPFNGSCLEMTVLDLIIDELSKTGSVLFEDYDHLATENRVRRCIAILKKKGWEFEHITRENYEGFLAQEGFAVVKMGEMA